MFFLGGGSSAGRGGVFCWEAGGFLESGVLQGEERAPLGGGRCVLLGGEGCVLLFQKLEFRELFAEVGAVGEGDGVDAEGLGGGDVGGVVVDKYAVGGLQ